MAAPKSAAPASPMTTRDRISMASLVKSFAKPTRKVRSGNSKFRILNYLRHILGGRAHVSRPRPDQAADRALFGNVGTPANHSRGGKHRGEQCSRDADAIEKDGGVELD